jgi:hypothetical protein
MRVLLEIGGRTVFSAKTKLGIHRETLSEHHQKPPSFSSQESATASYHGKPSQGGGSGYQWVLIEWQDDHQPSAAGYLPEHVRAS